MVSVVGEVRVGGDRGDRDCVKRLRFALSDSGDHVRLDLCFVILLLDRLDVEMAVFVWGKNKHNQLNKHRAQRKWLQMYLRIVVSQYGIFYNAKSSCIFGLDLTKNNLSNKYMYSFPRSYRYIVHCRCGNINARICELTY